MRIISSGTTRPARKRTSIKSADDAVLTATSVLTLISASCDELGEKLSLAIADKQFPDFEENAAKLVADLFSVAVSAERLVEDMNPAPQEGDDA